MSDKRLEEIVVHEHVHIIVNEMREWRDGLAAGALDHEERVTTALTWVIMGVVK